jgi:hypothetical protein
MEDLHENLDLSTSRIEQILPTLATKEDLKAFATKEDLKYGINGIRVLIETCGIRSACSRRSSRISLSEFLRGPDQRHGRCLSQRRRPVGVT